MDGPSWTNTVCIYLVGRFICARRLACMILYWSNGVVFRQKSKVADRGFVWWTDVAILICHSLKMDIYQLNCLPKTDSPDWSNLLFRERIATPKSTISNSCWHFSLELLCYVPNRAPKLNRVLEVLFNPRNKLQKLRFASTLNCALRLVQTWIWHFSMKQTSSFSSNQHISFN